MDKTWWVGSPTKRICCHRNRSYRLSHPSSLKPSEDRRVTGSCCRRSWRSTRVAEPAFFAAERKQRTPAARAPGPFCVVRNCKGQIKASAALRRVSIPLAAGPAAGPLWRAVAKATPASVLARLGDIHGNGAVPKLGAVDHADGLLSVRLGFHFDEGKSLRLPRFTVGDQGDRLHRSCLREQRLEVTCGSGVRQISNVQLCDHSHLSRLR